MGQFSQISILFLKKSTISLMLTSQKRTLDISWPLSSLFLRICSRGASVSWSSTISSWRVRGMTMQSYLRGARGRGDRPIAKNLKVTMRFWPAVPSLHFGVGPILVCLWVFPVFAFLLPSSEPSWLQRQNIYFWYLWCRPWGGGRRGLPFPSCIIVIRLVCSKLLWFCPREDHGTFCKERQELIFCWIFCRIF